MKVGTKSILFGVHNFIVHPITVYRAWKYLYGKPTWRELICIIIHDWGYWGKPNMDGAEGERHPEFAAKIAAKLFGQQYGDLCLWHSRHYARKVGAEPSKLCWADKLSIVMEPRWLYLLRAKLSGEIKEYRHTSANSGYIPLSRTNKEWFVWVSSWMEEMGKTQKNKPFMKQGECI